MAGPYCIYPFEQLHVHANGNAYMCCYQRMMPLGNLLEQSFEDVWFGPVAQEIRAEVLKSNLPQACRKGGCPFEVVPRHVADVHPAPRVPHALFVYLPNTHCNIGGEKPNERRPACLMCERSAPGYEFDTVDRLPELLPKLRPYLQDMIQVHVQGVAEAFWKDAIFNILDALEYGKHRERMFASTVTNATLLTKKKAVQFLEACPNSALGFSIDAASRETYKKIRRVDAFDIVCKNILEYSQIRKAYPKTYLKLQHNINTLNVHEVVEMVRFAKQAEADVIEFNATVGYRTEILVNESNWRVFAEAQSLATAEAKRLGMPIEFLTPLTLHYGDRAAVAPAI